MLNKEEKLQRQRETNRRYRERHKERLKAEKAQYLLDNPHQRKATTAKYREKVKPQQMKHRLDNFELYMLNHIKRRSKKSGIEFNLELDDIKIPEVCPILKMPLVKQAGKGRNDFSPSLDRINPLLGYTKGNVEVISDKANRMKNNASVEELLQFATEIFNRYG